MALNRKRYTIVFLPSAKRVVVPANTHLFRAAFLAGVTIVNVCGGARVCMQCRVQILKGNAPPDDDALAFLSQQELQDGYVLACHTPVNDDLEVFVPELRFSENGR